MPPKKNRRAFGRSKKAERMRSTNANENDGAHSQRLCFKRDRYATAKKDSLPHNRMAKVSREGVCRHTASHAVVNLDDGKTQETGVLTKRVGLKDNLANEIECIHTEELNPHINYTQCSNEHSEYVAKDVDVAKDMQHNLTDVTNQGVLRVDVDPSTPKHSQIHQIPMRSKRYTFKRKPFKEEPGVTKKYRHTMVHNSMDGDNGANNVLAKSLRNESKDCYVGLKTSDTYQSCERTPDDSVSCVTKSQTMKIQPKFDRTLLATVDVAQYTCNTTSKIGTTPNNERVPLKSKGRFCRDTDIKTTKTRQKRGRIVRPNQHTEEQCEKTSVDEYLTGVEEDHCYSSKDDTEDDRCIGNSYISRHEGNALCNVEHNKRILQRTRKNQERSESTSSDYNTNELSPLVCVYNRTHQGICARESLDQHSGEDVKSIGTVEQHTDTEHAITCSGDGQRYEDVSSDRLHTDHSRVGVCDVHHNATASNVEYTLNEDVEPTKSDVENSELTKYGIYGGNQCSASDTIKPVNVSVKCDTVKFKAPKRKKGTLSRSTKRAKLNRITRENEDRDTYIHRLENQREETAIRRESQVNDGRVSDCDIDNEVDIALKRKQYIMPESNALNSRGFVHGSGRNKCSGNPCLCKRKLKSHSEGFNEQQQQHRSRSENTHARRQYTQDLQNCMPSLKPLTISSTGTKEETRVCDSIEMNRYVDDMETCTGNMSARGRSASTADVTVGTGVTNKKRSSSCSKSTPVDNTNNRIMSASKPYTFKSDQPTHKSKFKTPLETVHSGRHTTGTDAHPGTSKERMPMACDRADSRTGNSSGLQMIDACGDNQDNNSDTGEPSSADRIRNIRTNVIRRLQRGDFRYDQFNNNPLMESGLEFYRQMEQITWSAPCSNCKESGIDLQVGVRSGTCMRCRGVRAKLFGPENDMDPGVAPAVLTELTPVEKAAISIISPSISIYKGGITSTSSKGHCVSFYQDIQQLATQLPHTPAELPIIVIKNPNERITDKNFTVRRANIISALEFLRDNSPDYRDIVINHENVELYPEDDILQTLPSVSPTDVNLPNENDTACNPESTTFGETTIDMAIASKTVKENIAEVVNNNAPPENNQHGQVNNDPVENDEPNGAPAQPMPWPAREAAPASEFAQGFYSKAFPDLFPYGRGDITKPRLHKNPSILCYFQHLMRLDRRFVRHHCFTFVATNIWRRHMALTLGNVFTKNSADGLTVQQLKESVNAGDDRVLKKLLYFAASIPGTRQHLRYQSDLALSFVDFIRINSNDTQMFNFFQTFSAADNHWDDLHRILPESDAYLTKTVKPAREVSAEGNGADIIDESTDFRLRTSALRNNADVVASFFRMRHLTYLNTVVKKLGMEDYIIRYEDQGRGCLHVHDLLLMSNGVSANDLKNAYKRPFPQGGFLNDPIYEAREKVIHFSTKTIGTSAVHPNGDPGQWPGPYGNNVQRPATNCLRERFVDVYEEGRMKQHYERLINRTMLHQCRMGYCLNDKNRDKDGNLICRFEFPEQPIGFDIDYSDSGVEILSATRNADAPNGARFLEEKLKFLRNHPTLVHHVPELLAIWGANIEGRPVKSYEQVIRYVMKYLMKPEPNSAPFSSICKAVIDSADDNEPAKKSLQKVLMKTVGENDLSKQLCHHLLSGHPIVEFSRTPICVNITSTRKVKRGDRNSPASTENMADVYWRRETDPNYRKIQDSYTEGKIDYDPSELTLYQFASRYTKRWELSRDEKFPHITPNFSVIPKKDGKYPDRYTSFLKMVLLTHKASTTFTEVEALSMEELEATASDFCDNNESCPRVIKEKYNESQMPAFVENEDDSDDEDVNQDPELLVEPERNRELYEQDDWMEAIGTIVRQVDDVMDNANDYNDQSVHAAAEQVDWNEDREYLNLTEQDLKNIPKWIKEEQQHGIEGINDIGNGASPNTLNEKQVSAFSIIRQHILLVKREGVDKVEQLLLNISGGAGSGKSYFLRVIKRFAEEIFERVGCVVAAAPSGTAAYLVDGETLHSLLHLPLDSRTYKALQGDQLRDLQQRFQNVCILIIDEKSMIGQRVFQMINLRLREARPHSAHLPFGGLSVVLMGDWSQLPPVFDKPLYDGETNCAEGYNLYALFNDTIVFDVIERQTDNTFKEELGRLSSGTFTVGDWEKWQSRSLQGMSNEQQQEFRRDAIMACALKADMVTHNKEKVLANGYPVAPMEAETNRSEAKRQSADNLCNIPQHIILNKNTVFRLTSNLWTKAGLTNGAVGVVRYIIYAPGIRPPKLPVAIIATFDSYKGRPYLHDLPKSVVISPVRREFRINNVSCFRIHLPIILGYALSIHRLQGNTLDKVIINIGSKEFASGLTYVGASRVRSFAGLSFHPYPNYERFEQISKSTKIKRRMEEEKRLLGLQASTMEKYSAAVLECAALYGAAPQ